jgi:prefoldin subunit 5
MGKMSMKVEEIIESLNEVKADIAAQMDNVVQQVEEFEAQSDKISQRIQQLEMQFAHLRLSLDSIDDAIEVLKKGS